MENTELLNHRLSEYFRSGDTAGPLKDSTGGSLAKEFGSVLTDSGNSGNLTDSVLKKDGKSFRNTKLTSFSDLYERAVKNVLNIRPFLEDVDDKLKGQEPVESRNDYGANDQRNDSSQGKDNPLLSNVNPNFIESKDREHHGKLSIKSEKVTDNDEQSFTSAFYLPRRRDSHHSNGFFTQVLAEHARFFGNNAYIPSYFTQAIYPSYDPHYDISMRPRNVFHPSYAHHTRWYPEASSHYREAVHGVRPWGRSPSSLEHAQPMPYQETIHAHRHSVPFHLNQSRDCTVSDRKVENIKVEKVDIKTEVGTENEDETENSLKSDDLETDQSSSSQSQSPIPERGESEKALETKKIDSENNKPRLKDSQQRIKYRPYGLRSRTSYLNQTIEVKSKTDANKKKDNKLLEAKRKNLSPKEKYLLYLGLFKVKQNGPKQNNVKICGMKQSNKQSSKFCKEK